MSSNRKPLNLVALSVALIAVAIALVVVFLLKVRPPSAKEAASAGTETTEKEKESRSGRISGTVFEAMRDAPVSGALVKVATEPNLEVVTNGAGKFDITLPAGITTLIPEADGLRSAGRDDHGVTVKVIGGSELTGIQLFLYEPATVEGSVIGDEQPLEATVEAHYLRDASEALDTVADGVDTDVDGRFRLANLPPGDLEVIASAPGFATLVVPVGEIWAGSSSDVGVIELRRGARVSGRVLAGDVPTDGISLRLASRVETLHAASAGGGRFEFYGVEKGLWRLTAGAVGYREFGEVVDVPDGGELEVEVGLTALSGLIVRLLNPAGEATSSPKVTVMDLGSGLLVETFAGTGEDHRVNVLAGGPFRVEAIVPDSTDIVATEVALGSVAVLVLGGDGGITGLVLDSSGNRADTAQVQLIRNTEVGTTVAAPWAACVEGHFLFEHLAPGTYRLDAKAPGYRETRLDDVFVEAGRVTSQTLRLSSGGILKGRVFDVETQNGVPNAQVSLELGEASTAAGPDGTYELAGFPEGRHTVRVSAPGFDSELLSGLQIDDGRIEVRDVGLTPGVDGEPTETRFVGVGIQIRNLDGQVVIDRPIDGGAGSEAGLEAGDIIVSVDGQDAAELGFVGVLESIRGEPDTTVRIGVMRNGQRLEFPVGRQEVVVEPHGP